VIGSLAARSTPQLEGGIDEGYAGHWVLAGILLLVVCTRLVAQSPIGREVAIPRHLDEGDEFRISVRSLVEHGRRLFAANWTSQEGGGRPLTKGTGAAISDPSTPLVFPRNFNRVSAPDANSCAGCHNAPFGIAGGGGDTSPTSSCWVSASTSPR
jgi:hypothetical protein